MALKLTQRQIDALHADAVEEGKAAQRSADIQRIIDQSMARTHVHPPQAPVFTTHGDLKPGTILVGTDDGRSFHHSARIVSLDLCDQRPDLKPDEGWLSYISLDQRGSGGSRVKLSDRVLILAGTGRVL